MIKPLESGNKTLLAGGLALLAGVTCIFPCGFLTRWIAAAVLLVTAPILWAAITKAAADLDQRRRALAATILPYAAVTAGVLMALGPIALGEMPVSQDHANHYYATHILVNEMIPSGRFFGWTDSIGTGYPYGDTYHTTPYLLTGFLHLLSGKVIGLPTSYAFGITLAWLIPALAVTVWSRRIAGPYAATLAGLAFALDMGTDREGGWIYAMFHGVWAQHFATGLWLFGLLALVRLAEKQTTRRLAVAVLVPGLSIWCHPMNAVNMLLSGLLLIFVYFLYAQKDKPGAPYSLFPALAGAALLSLTWVVRMVLAGDMVYAGSADWAPLDRLMVKLLGGNLFDNQLAFLGALSIVGALQMIRQGGRFRHFTVLTTAVLVVVGSMLVLLETDAGLAGEKLGLIQFRRFSLAAKPLWFAMAGAGLTAVARGFISHGAERLTARFPVRVLTAVLLAPIVLSLIQAMPGRFRSPVARPLTAKKTGDQANLNALARLLEKEHEQCAGDFCKAVYWEKPGHGGLYPVIAMADAGFAWQTTLPLPANNFKWINPTMNVETMGRLGVSVVISKWQQNHHRLQEIGRFGRHYVYRLLGYSTDRAQATGGGRAEVSAWEPERKVVKLSGGNDQTVLTLTLPPYRKWRATQAGRTLSTTHRSRDGLVLLAVTGARDGEVMLTYEDTAAEKLFSLLGILILAVCFAGCVIRPRALPKLIREAHYPGVVRATQIGLGCLGVGALIALVLVGSYAARREWLGGEPAGTHLLTVLHRQTPSNVTVTPADFCVPAYVRNPRFDCSERDLLPSLVPLPRRRGLIPSCLQVGVPARGETAVAFDLPDGATHIKGRLYPARTSAVSATLKLNGSQTPLIGTGSFDVRLDGVADQVTFVFKSESRTEICFEAAALTRP